MRQLNSILFLLLFIGQPFARENGTNSWSVVKDGRKAGDVLEKVIGDESFLDALNAADLLDIYYFKDTADRYLFSFPGLPVVFVPDGTFAQVGLEVVHFPLPAFLKDFHLYVPEDLFLDLLGSSLPGNCLIDKGNRVIRYYSPSSDIVEVRRFIEDGNPVVTITLTYPFKSAIARGENGEILLTVSDATVGSALDSLEQADDVPIILRKEDRESIIHLTSPEPILSAHLEGPDLGNVLTLRFIVGEDSTLEVDGGIAGELEAMLRAEKKRWLIDKIVIDPGHGGKDPGAIGKGKLYEKNVVLGIGKRLRNLLKKRLKVSTVMTRDKDIFIPLGDRTRFANRENGKLFISIHCNSARSSRARGQETFFLAPAKTERAMQVAMKENEVIKYEESQERYKELTNENFIRLSMAQSGFTAESRDLAKLIQKHLHRQTGLKDRGIDQAGFYVLVGASMPSVLVETGFISNQKEAKLLKSGTFQEKVAKGICDAVEEFIASQ